MKKKISHISERKRVKSIIKSEKQNFSLLILFYITPP